MESDVTATRVLGIAVSLVVGACASHDRDAAVGEGEHRSAAKSNAAETTTAGKSDSTARAAPTDPHGDVAHDLVEPGLIERPIGLRSGIGSVHQSVTAPANDDVATAQARRYFDQGLTLLHDFVWIDAARSFQETLRRSPDCALAWVGLSRAQSGLGDAPAARAAIEKARAAAPKVTQREQRFVELRALQLDAMEASGDKQKELHAQYKKALEQAIAEFPDEVEFTMLRANAEEPSPGGIGQVAERGSIEWYQRVADAVPDHVGAHHGLCHAWENAGEYAKALADAEKFRDLAPAVPHSWHMCGHDLPRLGRWQDALAQFAKSEELHAEQAAAEHLRPGDDWHRAHNLLLLGYTQLRLVFANEVAPDVAIATFRQQFETPIRSGRPRYTHAALAEALLALQRDDEALPVTQQLQTYEQPAGTRSAGAALEGEILLRRGDRAAAQRKLEQSDAALAEEDAGGAEKSPTSKPPSATPPAAPKPAPNKGVRIHRTMLAAMLDLQGDAESAARGEQALLSFADEIAGNARFDAWGEGLFRLDRAWHVATQAGYADLAAKLRERMAKIDPQFEPR